MRQQAIGKILVVDDEIELMNALVEGLLKRSFDTRGYTSGHEALEALRAETFDLLVSDLKMPEMDGITLVKAALQIDPGLVVLIMTGQASTQAAEDAQDVGVFDYVLKPFRLQTLVPILTRALATRRSREGIPNDVEQWRHAAARRVREKAEDVHHNYVWHNECDNDRM